MNENPIQIDAPTLETASDVELAEELLDRLRPMDSSEARRLAVALNAWLLRQLILSS
jgi:hypothetical protein